jgi:hypothetical protein
MPPGFHFNVQTRHRDRPRGANTAAGGYNSVTRGSPDRSAVPAGGDEILAGCAGRGDWATTMVAEKVFRLVRITLEGKGTERP